MNIQYLLDCKPFRFPLLRPRIIVRWRLFRNRCYPIHDFLVVLEAHDSLLEPRLVQAVYLEGVALETEPGDRLVVVVRWKKAFGRSISRLD